MSNTAVTWPCASPWRTRPPSPRAAEGQGEGVEQDRLAGARLAVRTDRPSREFEVEPVDQDDVANRQLDQHGDYSAVADPVG